MNQDIKKENINKFINKYGIKGFYTLYLTNYFNEIITSEIKSLIDSEYTSNDPKNDSIYLLYKNTKNKFDFSEIKKYENDIYNECKKVAEKIVDNLSNEKDFSQLFNKDSFDVKIDKNKEKKIKSSLDAIILDYLNKISDDEKNEKKIRKN